MHCDTYANHHLRLLLDENDLIIDPFCGSGLGVASYLNNCKYIGIDTDAIKICKERINEFCVSSSQVVNASYSKFQVLEAEIRDFIIKINGSPVERNKGLDAVVSSGKGLVGIRFQRENESIFESASRLKKASARKPLVKLIVVKTHDSNLLEYEQPDILIIDSL